MMQLLLSSLLLMCGIRDTDEVSNLPIVTQLESKELNLVRQVPRHIFFISSILLYVSNMIIISTMQNLAWEEEYQTTFH